MFINKLNKTFFTYQIICVKRLADILNSVRQSFIFIHPKFLEQNKRLSTSICISIINDLTFFNLIPYKKICMLQDYVEMHSNRIKSCQQVILLSLHYKCMSESLVCANN